MSVPSLNSTPLSGPDVTMSDIEHYLARHQDEQGRALARVASEARTLTIPLMERCLRGADCGVALARNPALSGMEAEWLAERALFEMVKHPEDSEWWRAMAAILRHNSHPETDALGARLWAVRASVPMEKRASYLRALMHWGGMEAAQLAEIVRETRGTVVEQVVTLRAANHPALTPDIAMMLLTIDLTSIAAAEIAGHSAIMADPRCRRALVRQSRKFGWPDAVRLVALHTTGPEFRTALKALAECSLAHGGEVLAVATAEQMSALGPSDLMPFIEEGGAETRVAAIAASALLPAPKARRRRTV